MWAEHNKPSINRRFYNGCVFQILALFFVSPKATYQPMIPLYKQWHFRVRKWVQIAGGIEGPFLDAQALLCQVTC